MTVEETKIGNLKPYPRNAKKHPEKQVRQIAESIRKFGWAQPIAIDKDGVIILGHGRYEAAKLLELHTVPCVMIDDLTEEEVRMLRLADNKLNESEWDDDILKFELDDLDFGDLDFDWGLDDAEIAPVAVYEDDPSMDSIPTEAVAKYGDIYQLGNHRLMCGDSTKADDVKKLLGGVVADITFTSPPYNAGTTPTEIKSNKQSKYENDSDNKSSEEYETLLISATKNALKYSKFVFINVQSLSGNKRALIDWMKELEEYYADTIIWDKERSQPAMANNVLNSEFEFVYVFSKGGSRAIGTIPFRGTLTNIIHISNGRRSEYADVHNATFPMEFAAYFCQNFAKESVLDLFGGTGTTMIACEQLGRTCFMMELEPIYVDIIINRWEQFTGEKTLKIDGADID